MGAVEVKNACINTYTHTHMHVNICMHRYMRTCTLPSEPHTCSCRPNRRAAIQESCSHRDQHDTLPLRPRSRAQLRGSEFPLLLASLYLHQGVEIVGAMVVQQAGRLAAGQRGGQRLCEKQHWYLRLVDNASVLPAPQSLFSVSSALPYMQLPAICTGTCAATCACDRCDMSPARI